MDAPATAVLRPLCGRRLRRSHPASALSIIKGRAPSRTPRLGRWPKAAKGSAALGHLNDCIGIECVERITSDRPAIYWPLAGI